MCSVIQFYSRIIRFNEDKYLFTLRPVWVYFNRFPVSGTCCKQITTTGVFEYAITKFIQHILSTDLTFGVSWVDSRKASPHTIWGMSVLVFNYYPWFIKEFVGSIRRFYQLISDHLKQIPSYGPPGFHVGTGKSFFLPFSILVPWYLCSLSLISSLFLGLTFNIYPAHGKF